MSVLKDFRDAVIELVTTDATFVAAVTALLGVAVLNGIKTNRPLEDIPAGMWPCWVTELGNGTAASISNDGGFIQTLGLSQQTFKNELYLILVWKEKDRELAADARAELPVLLTQLFLRNPQPGGVDGATVIGFEPDRAINHPNQVWRAMIEADMTFMRGA
jgi:hypothetical protein